MSLEKSSTYLDEDARVCIDLPDVAAVRSCNELLSLEGMGVQTNDGRQTFCLKRRFRARQLEPAFGHAEKITSTSQA